MNSEPDAKGPFENFKTQAIADVVRIFEKHAWLKWSVLAVVGLVGVGLLTMDDIRAGLILMLKHIGQWVAADPPRLVLLVVAVILLIAALWGAARSKRLNGEVQRQAAEIARLTAERNAVVEAEPVTVAPVAYGADPKFGRFEQIQKLRYGHIGYAPLLDYDDTRKPHGIGVRVLEECVRPWNIMLTPTLTATTWKKMLSSLEEDKFDIVATPIFETRDRLQRVSFSTPMFFSDVGIYVRRNYRIAGRSVNTGGMSFREAIAFLKEASVNVSVIEGELSEKLANKHLNAGAIYRIPPDEARVYQLLQALSSGEECDVVFVERLIAEQYKEVEHELVNLLAPGELLYPVGFALRRKDYILRNFINLRLMEIDDKKDRLLGLVLDEIRKVPRYAHFDMAKLKEYFVRSKDLRRVA